MKKVLRLIAMFAVCNSLLITSCSQPAAEAFADEIKEFKKFDKAKFPEKGAILFVGSSSFRMWNDMQSYFPGYKVINRGFGGSSLPDVIRYADQIILPYKPRQVVIYCGENDIAGGPVSAEQVLTRFMELFKIIRNDLPDAHVAFVSIKPSPSREKYMQVMEEANMMIRQFLAGQKSTVYIDVYNKMLDKDGKPRPELFIEDMLHMNEKGYAIWKEAITPHLVR